MVQFDAFEDGAEAGGRAVGSTSAGTTELSHSSVGTGSDRDRRPRAGGEYFSRSSWQ